MDDFVLNVRQIGQYPRVAAVGANDALLLQVNGAGGAYAYVTPLDLFASALMQQGKLGLAANSVIQWANGPSISLNGSNIVLSPNAATGTLTADSVVAQSIKLAGQDVATVDYVNGVASAVFDHTVHSFNGRSGDIQLLDTDILRAGGVLAINPHFAGVVTAPTIWNPQDCSDAVATTAFVQNAICAQLESGHVVLTYNGRGGHVVPIADDVTTALTVPGEWGLCNTPPSGDVSKRIANTAFVDDAIYVMSQELQHDFSLIADALDQKYAPLDSPQFVGIPTGPTAAQTVNSGQLATTAFVHAAVTASTTGVSSFNTRTGAVTLTTADVTGAGGAPILSPAFTGNPTAATQTIGDSSTRLATTAFVQAAVGAVNLGVTTFNTRSGAVTLTTADVTGVGGALLASPTFTGTPAGPTATPGTNTTQFATTAFVTQAISVLPAPVTSFNGRTGAVNFQASDVSAVGGALLASPAFTGVPTAPTATAGTSNTQLATTAFVQAALGGVVSGVSSFNSRTGAVTFQASDVTGVGGALLAGPTLTGVPAAPTATIGTNTTQIATTAFVQAALAAAPGGVSSFNGRTGAITFLAADVSAVGGALLSSPAFSGNPTAPTPAPGDNDTSIATTAFVATAIAGAGGVNSFNGRAGVVTLNGTDIANAAGALLTVGTAPPTGVPATANHAFWWDSGGGQLYINYDDGNSTQWVAAAAPQTAPVQQAAVLIATQAANNNVLTFQLPSGFKYFEFIYDTISSASAGGNVGIQFSTDGGTTWITASSYASQYTYNASNASGGPGAQVGTPVLIICPFDAALSGLSSGGTLAGRLTLYGPGASQSWVSGDFLLHTTAFIMAGNFYGRYNATLPSRVNAVKFLTGPGSAPNLTTGNVSLYGYPS